jgi:hypothetical protein
MPALGAPIDRVGRAGINMLLTRTFDPDPRARDQARDAYNLLEPDDADTVAGDFLEAVRIFDGMDRHCGNSFLSVTNQLEGRYDRRTARLGDDVLYVDTRARSCWFYLGLETDELGVMPNADCGGRTLTQDVVDLTYALLVNNLRGPIRDGVARDDRSHSNEVFPFVAEPPPGPASPVAAPSQPDPEPVFEPNSRSCKNLGYTDEGGGGGATAFGGSCGLSSQCAGENGVCVLNTCFYGGYCTILCNRDSDCASLGANTTCEMVGVRACVRTCATDADCGRTGYQCGPENYCISQDH